MCESMYMHRQVLHMCRYCDNFGPHKLILTHMEDFITTPPVENAGDKLFFSEQVRSRFCT